MPYESDAQRKFFHTPTAKVHGITKTMIREYDQASKGMDLPEHKDPKPQEVTSSSKSHWRK